MALKNLTPDQIIAAGQAVALLISAGVATVDQVVAGIKALSGKQLTDVELNAICDAIIADATIRLAQAKSDAGQ